MANTKKVAIKVTSPVTLDNNRYYGRGGWKLEEELCREIVSRGAGTIDDAKVQAKVKESIQKGNDSKPIGGRAAKKKSSTKSTNKKDESGSIPVDAIGQKMVDALFDAGIKTINDLKAVIAAEDGKEQLDVIEGVGDATIQKLILIAQD